MRRRWPDSTVKPASASTSPTSDVNSIILQAESIHADKVAHIANLFQGQAGEIIPDYDVDVTGHCDPFLAFEILHATLPEGDSQ